MYRLGNNILKLNNKLIYGSGAPVFGFEMITGSSMSVFPSTYIGGSKEASFTVDFVGAETGDTVILGLSKEALSRQIYYYGVVSAKNKITVRCINMSISIQQSNNNLFRFLLLRYKQNGTHNKTILSGSETLEYPNIGGYGTVIITKTVSGVSQGDFILISPNPANIPVDGFLMAGAYDTDTLIFKYSNPTNVAIANPFTLNVDYIIIK